MTFSFSRAAVLLAAVAVFAACPPPVKPPPPQQCPPHRRVCDSDRVCGGGFCDKTHDSADGVTGDGIPAANDPLGCCVILICTTNADCASNEKCDERKQICIPKDLCDPSEPNGGSTCGDNSTDNCCQTGQVCIYNEGTPQCVASPPPPTKCFVSAGGRPIASATGANPSSPDGDGNFPAVVATGTLQLEVVGTDDSGKNVPDATFTWSGTGVDATTGVFTPAACATGVCQTTVTATDGSATCTGVVNTYAPPTAGSARITVLDLDTGAPVAGEVSANIGTAVTSGTTDANGSKEFVGTATALSVFADSYQWHTIVDPPQDLVIYSKHIPDATKVAGISGTFDFTKVHTTGDIKLGLAGTAISAAITDLNFTTLIGDIAKYHVKIEGITDSDVPLPSGIEIDLGDTPIKGDYVTFGDPGKNIGWALGGEVALADVGPIISGVAGGSNVDVGNILGGVLPFFGKFDHAVVTGLNLQQKPKPPTDPANPDAPIPTASYGFDTISMQPNTLLSLAVDYAVPTLPCSAGQFNNGTCTPPTDTTKSAYQSGAVLLAGVVVPGVGLVPLGLTAGLDEPDTGTASEQDGLIEAKQGTNDPPQKGHGRIDYAPPHDGLEGSTFITVALALDLSQITGSKGLGTSILTHVAKKYDKTSNNFPAGAFLQSQGGQYTPDDGTGNTGTFAMEAIGTADFYRLNVHDANSQEWNIWFKDATTIGSITPATYAPTDALANAGERFKTANVQAFKLGAGYAGNIGGPEPTTYDDLFSFNGTNLDNLLYYLGAWSSQACKGDGTCIDSSAPPPTP
jgi:hypothetical protein